MSKDNRKLLYLTYISKAPLNYCMKMSLDINDYIKKYFDIQSIIDIEKVDISKYDLVLISGLIFTREVLTKLTLNDLYKKIKYVSKIPNVVYLFHDLHDYSIDNDYLNKSMRKINGKTAIIPILEDNEAKRLYDKIFRENNIKYLISQCDCPEYDFFVKYLKTIKDFYVINHGYSNKFFKPIPFKKEYDILFYGRNFAAVYPFRNRLLNIFKNLKIRVHVVNYKKKIYGKELCKLINKSWLCIACVSNFSYFVRKYLEISACNAVVLGDINGQGFNIIGTNMVYVNNNMSNNAIINKALYYLQNKDILAAISFNKLENIEKENYESVIDKIKNISDSILNGNESIYSYKKYQKGIVKNITHTKTLITITFDFVNGSFKSENTLNKGLYVFVVDNTTKQNKFDVHDESNIILTKKETYVSDSRQPNFIYVPFKLNQDSGIILVGDCEISNLKLYNIN